MEPSRRYEMVQAGQCPTVPQVHAKGKVSPAAPVTSQQPGGEADPCGCQFVGTLEILQELEDFGELDAKLW